MRLSPLLALPLLLSLSVAVRADEAKTYDLTVKAVYKVGEILTTTTKDETQQDIQVMAADGTPVFVQNEKDVIEFASTRKVLEIDDEGRISKELMHFSAWKRTKGDESATDLTGAHVEVTGRGPARAWKVLTPGLTPGKPTAEWLEKQYGPDEKGEFEEAMRPSKPIAINESWEIDVVKLAASMGKKMKLDPAKSTAKGTLLRIDGDIAAIRVEMKLQVVSIAAEGDMTMTVTEGGQLEMTGEGTLPMTADARADGGSMTMKLVATTDAPQNMTAKMAIEGNQRKATKAGGEMPAIPEVK